MIEITYINYLEHNEYKKILVVNILPDNIFKTIIKQIKPTKLSIFEPSSKCIYAILNPENKSELLELSNIGLLFNFFTLHKFKLSTIDIKQNKKFICYVTS